MANYRHLELFGLTTLPLVQQGDDVGRLISEAVRRSVVSIQNRDVIVVAQKIISKAEGAVVQLRDVIPSERALALAQQTGRDPRLCQVYLDEAKEVLRVKGRMVITKHRLGFECSSSGVDRSNTAAYDCEIVSLLPQDPNASAGRIRQTLLRENSAQVAVIISDSFGRPDRDGSVGIAIGIAGIQAIEKRSQKDLYGNDTSPRIALIDELAAAASILMGQADERCPVVIIRGAQFSSSETSVIQEIVF